MAMKPIRLLSIACVLLLLGLGCLQQGRAQLMLTGAGAGGVGGGGSTLKTGLVSFWEFENTSWTDAVIGTGNDLTGSGSPTSVAGKVGNAISCVSASSQFVGHVSNASLQSGGTDFSFAAWVNFTTFTSGTIGGKSGGFGTFEWRLTNSFTSGQRVRLETFFSGTNSAGTVDSNTFGNLNASTWYFVVATYTSASKTMAISVNASAQDTAIGTNSISSFAADFQMGSNNSSAFLNGLIDQAGWWKKVLSASEITQLYNGGAGLSYAAM